LTKALTKKVVPPKSISVKQNLMTLVSQTPSSETTPHPESSETKPLLLVPKLKKRKISMLTIQQQQLAHAEAEADQQFSQP